MSKICEFPDAFATSQELVKIDEEVAVLQEEFGQRKGEAAVLKVDLERAETTLQKVWQGPVFSFVKLWWASLHSPPDASPHIHASSIHQIYVEPWRPTTSCPRCLERRIVGSTKWPRSKGMQRCCRRTPASQLPTAHIWDTSRRTCGSRPWTWVNMPRALFCWSVLPLWKHPNPSKSNNLRYKFNKWMQNHACFFFVCCFIARHTPCGPSHVASRPSTSCGSCLLRASCWPGRPRGSQQIVCRRRMLWWSMKGSWCPSSWIQTAKPWTGSSRPTLQLRSSFRRIPSWCHSWSSPCDLARSWSSKRWMGLTTTWSPCCGETWWDKVQGKQFRSVTRCATLMTISSSFCALEIQVQLRCFLPTLHVWLQE